MSIDHRSEIDWSEMGEARQPKPMPGPDCTLDELEAAVREWQADVEWIELQLADPDRNADEEWVRRAKRARQHKKVELRELKAREKKANILCNPSSGFAGAPLSGDDVLADLFQAFRARFSWDEMTPEEQDALQRAERLLRVRCRETPLDAIEANVAAGSPFGPPRRPGAPLAARLRAVPQEARP